MRVEVLPGDGSKWRKELMTEEYVSVKFSLKEHVRLRKGDHVSIDGVGDFELVKTSRPKWNTSKGCWDYEQKFHAEWEKWKNRKFFFNRQSGNLEKTWSLTQYITYFLDLFIGNLKAAGLGDNWRWQVDDRELLSTIKNITFDGVSLFDGITSIAKTWGCEWWVDGRTVHLGKCEFGKAVRFEIGGYITDMSASESDGEYCNRLYAFGSTRNIPKNYRGEQSQTAIEGVVQKRLMLPAGTNYVDAWPNMDKDDVVEGIVIFDDIYPRRVGTLYGVTTKEYTDTIEEEDGTTTENKWKAYRYKDAGLTFKTDYMIDGEELRIVFQSGLLAGCDFGVIFNPDAKKDESDPLAQVFEIVRNEDYGIQLPNDTLKPQDGDKYVLYGFDTRFVGETYLPAAENELLDKAIDQVMKMVKDDNTYTCPTDPVACAGYYIDPQKGQMFNADRIVDLDVGQSVLLVNETYFGTENRESRVRAFEKDLNNIYKCSYECGQSPRYSFFSKKEQQVSTITYNGKTYVSIAGNGSAGGEMGGGSSNIYVLKRYDTVTPTDSNVFSAARALAEFVSKQRDDIVGGHLTLNKGFTAKDIGRLLGGALFGQFIEGLKGGRIDAEGNSELNELIVRTNTLLNALRVKGVSEFDGNLFSRDFVSGFVSGRGWGITQATVKNALGVDETKYTGEFDNLIVRGAMRIFTLVVSQLLGENDNRIFTAMLEVDHYDPTTGRVYLKTQDGKLYNPFRKGDYIMVQQYNGMPDSSNDYYITKHYELIITAAGVGDLSDKEDRLDWVEFKNFTTAIDGGTALSLIKEGDTFCRVDNETDADRKGIIQIMTVGAATPYIDIAYGLKTNPEEALKGRIGNLQGIYNPLFGQLEGFGELLINLYAVGDFRLRRTGESVDAKIEMLKNVFATQYQKQTYEMTEDDNYLTNATFTENMDGWTPDADEDTALLAYDDGTPIVLNGSVVSSGLHRANVEEYDGKQMLHIQATGITQANALIRKPGTHKEYDQPAAGSTATTDASKDVQDTLYLSIKLLPKTAGKLTVGFKYSGSVPQGKTNTLPYTSAKQIAKSMEWQLLQFEGTWHGLGDFYLHYTGEMYVSILSVTDKALDEFKRTVTTQIIQTSDNIKLLGTNISKNGAAITQLGIDLDAADRAIRLYVDTQDEDLERRLGIVISDTEKAVKLYAEEYAKGYTDGELQNYYTKSQIDVTVNGINQSVISINNNITQITSDITSLQSQIDAANSAIEANEAATNNLQTYVDGAFADGIVSEAEKIAIEKYLNTLETTKKDVDAAYNDIIGNAYLEQASPAYTALVTAKSDVDSKYESLVTEINNTIADGKATTSEITAVNTAFSKFNAAIKTFSTRVEEANEAIQDAIMKKANDAISKVWADTQTQLSAVRGEISDANAATTALRNYVDGAFQDGVLTDAEKAALRTYINTLDTEGKELEKAYTELYGNSYLTGTPKSNLKTAYDNMVTYRGTLINVINAKLQLTKVTSSDIAAVDTAFDNYQTAIGTFSTRVEEANEAIQDAIMKKANDAISKVWADTQTQLSAVRGEISDANAATTALRNYVDGAFQDGVLTDAEKAALRTYINTLDTEGKELEKAYTELYGNSYLTGTPKSNLKTAYDNMVTYRGTLINVINAKLQLTKVTSSDIAAVDTAFDNYQTAIGTFSTRVEEANEAIRAAIKAALESEVSAAEERAKAKAKELADEAALGEYYNQSNNPWNSWAGGTEWRHIGAKWKATTDGVNYGNGSTVAGKLYRFYGGSTGNQNMWEEVNEAAVCISYISQTKDHISAVVANFDADGNVTAASGIATTAEGNKLWASKSDFDTLSGTVSTHTTQITNNATAIGLRAYSSTVDALTGRVTNCESRLDINDTRISLSVEKDGVISAINQSAETVQISASKIKLEGYTTINSSFAVDVDGTTRIGGFKVSGNGLTNTPFDNDAYIIFRNDSHNIFAGFGGNILPATSGARGLARFENKDSDDWWGLGTNYSVLISAQGGAENVALHIDGGNIQGIALKTQIIGLDTISQTTEPTSSTKYVTLTRYVNAVYASTQWFWNNTSKSPAVKNTKTRDIYITLPTMNHYDDGHMIMIKRGSNDGSTLRIAAGGSYHREYNTSTYKWEDKYYSSYLVTENDIEETATTKLDKEGYAAVYIYFRDLTVTMNNTTYKGAWMEFRNPRYW